MAMRYEPYGNSRARMEWDQRFICRRGPSKPALTSSTCMPKYMTRPTITQIRTSDLDKAKGGRATVSSTLAEPLTLDVDGLSDYVGTLKLLSAATERMFSLLADQITNVKHALPVEKGRENLALLRERSRAHKASITKSLEPLREEIGKRKAEYVEKNKDRVLQILKSYVVKRVKERVGAELDNRLKRYEGLLDSNDSNNEKLLEVTRVSTARTENSLLLSKHRNEEVTMTRPLPSQAPPVTLDQLLKTPPDHVVGLMKFLGLAPNAELTEVGHMDNLGRVLDHLGLRYRPLASRGTILLFPLGRRVEVW